MDLTIFFIGLWAVIGVISYGGSFNLTVRNIKSKYKKFLYDFLHGPIVWMCYFSVWFYDKVWFKFIGYRIRCIKEDILRWFEKE